MVEDTDIVQVETAVKKRGRGGKYNFPTAIDPDTESPEDIRKAAQSSLYWMKKGRDDKPETDDEIQSRVDEFLLSCYETGQRATVEKLALALGVTRKCLWEWEMQSNRRGNIIKSAKEYLAAFDADLATSGKMNPVPYIFRAKNYYGMKDQTDITIEPRQGIADQDAETVAAKYAELPPD